MGFKRYRVLALAVLLLGLEGKASEDSQYFKIRESWGADAIQNSFGMEKAFYSDLVTFLTYEGPFSFFSNMTYRIVDGIEVDSLEDIAQLCQEKSGRNVWAAIECASKSVQQFLIEETDPDGLCRVYSESFSIVMEHMNYWQISVSKKSLGLKVPDGTDYQHVLNTFAVRTEGGFFEYVIDVGNFPNELFPNSRAAKNYHLKFGQKLPKVLESFPIPDIQFRH